MEQLFENYQKYILTLISLTSSENSSQSGISCKERNKVAEIENEYSKITSELDKTKQTIRSQYESVWESCTSNAGLQIPRDLHPISTNLSLQECIRIQEQATKEIQEWFTIKTQEAIAERQRKLQQEAARKQARAVSAAEAERKRKEEATTLEKMKGASLLEEMKRKFRNKL